MPDINMHELNRQNRIDNNVPGFKFMLSTSMMRGQSLEEAKNLAAYFIELGDGADPFNRDCKLEALDLAEIQLKQEFNANIHYMTRTSLRCARPDWYAGPDAQARVWPALKRRLLEVKGRSEKEVAGVDQDSTAVVSLLSNPGLKGFKDRGLVIGHVQSGKTGNIAAVIAKAADTPYKFFVVLSGMTDVLRRQTQVRLDEDIINNGNPQGWHAWTDAENDFKHPAVGGFPLGGNGGQSHIAVIKKNAGILRRFIRKIQQTPQDYLESTPFLVIDDECDQASVNANGLHNQVTTINRLIRVLLNALPRVTYVGYTATPFANVLIDPNAVSPGLDQDLYPKDFIHALERPEAYFGAVELFGREALEGESMEDAEAVESGYDMIRIVPDAECEIMRKAHSIQGRTSGFPVTESLDKAIKYFILASSARCVRGQQDMHSTMLVHTSMLNVIHQATRQAVSAHVEQLTDRITARDVDLLSELERLWKDEASRVTSESWDNDPVDFSALSVYLESIAKSIEVKVENYISLDRIDYSLAGRKYIVIGGNVLARGLTLEGLIVSYFLRTTSQYDTLMQMGRWFGYRPNFQEFPRVWMEQEISSAFFDLATIEEEIRRYTRRYAEENLTPMDFALPIRLIAGLSPTATSKMRNGVRMQIGYEGEHRQTINFRRKDKGWLQSNWDAGAALLDVNGNIETKRGNKVKYSVDAADIITFIKNYSVHNNGSLNRDLIVKYIEKLNSEGRLRNWNVVVIGSRKSNAKSSQIPLGSAGNVRCVTRAPLRDSGAIASIKALMSRQDLFADCDEVPSASGNWSWDDIKEYRHQNQMLPMLIFYPISADSIPSAHSQTSREPMNAEMDLLGVGIVFSGRPGGGTEYIQADIQPVDAEDGEDLNDALPEEEFVGDADSQALPEEMNDACL